MVMIGGIEEEKQECGACEAAGVVSFVEPVPGWRLGRIYSVECQCCGGSGWHDGAGPCLSRETIIEDYLAARRGQA